MIISNVPFWQFSIFANLKLCHPVIHFFHDQRQTDFLILLPGRMTYLP